jgi:hypothetical protein
MYDSRIYQKIRLAVDFGLAPRGGLTHSVSIRNWFLWVALS